MDGMNTYSCEDLPSKFYIALHCIVSHYCIASIVLLYCNILYYIVLYCKSANPCNLLFAKKCLATKFFLQIFLVFANVVYKKNMV